MLVVRLEILVGGSVNDCNVSLIINDCDSSEQFTKFEQFIKFAVSKEYDMGVDEQGFDELYESCCRKHGNKYFIEDSENCVVYYEIDGLKDLVER